MTQTWRKDFPIFAEALRGKRLVYLDSAASTQKPESVIMAMDDCYRHGYSNIHRGVHYLSQQLSARYEAVRAQVARFVNAPAAENIVFCKGTTDGMNLLASSLGSLLLKPGDRVLITAMEHHANIVPWQIACARFGAELVVLPMDERGVLDLEQLDALLPGVKIFSFTHVSNALGTINDIRLLCAKAREHGAVSIVDGAQAIAHIGVDVQALDCDFYLFSAHKMYGPTGIGVLYGKSTWLDAMPPYQGGGDMILSVSFEKTVYAEPPLKFEAGTPPIVEVIGLGAALDWLQKAGIDALAHHENRLREQAQTALAAMPGVRLIGQAPEKAAVISFVLDGIHPHDAGTFLDQYGVAVRVGHHCAEPVMRFFAIPATIRASFAAYNDDEDVRVFLEAVRATQEFFA